MPTWDDLVLSAVKCGLTEDEFEQMTWRQFMIHLKAEDERKAEQWNQTRSIGYMIYLSSTTDKHPKSIKKFWPLPWDEVEQEEKPISKDQLQRTIQMMKNL